MDSECFKIQFVPHRRHINVSATKTESLFLLRFAGHT